MSSLYLPTNIHGLFSSRSTSVRILGQWLYYLDSCAMPTPTLIATVNSRMSL